MLTVFIINDMLYSNVKNNKNIVLSLFLISSNINCLKLSIYKPTVLCLLFYLNIIKGN